MATRAQARGKKAFRKKAFRMTHGRQDVVTTVRFTEDEVDLRRLLEARAVASYRSLSGQIKHYARLAAIAEDNPDLPMTMIHGILEAQAELKAGLGQPYQWGVIESDPA
jgi:ParD-like antitoxin of type II bacterial toxin-antitoxin system